MNILHAKVLGEGEPLFILHGFLGMSDNWKTLGSQYAKLGFEVHLIDQRNHGKSFHDEDFDYEVLAADLIMYMDHYGIAATHLIGHSMGGKTVMQLANTHAKRVKKLIVADIAPKYYPPHHQTIIDALNALVAEPITSRKQADTQLSKAISNLGIRQFLLKNLYWKTKEHLDLRVNLAVLSHKMEEIGAAITSADQFHGPTLFLRGERSDYVLSSDFQSIKTQFPNAKLATVENAGHWLHAENPKQFFTLSKDFLIS